MDPPFGRVLEQGPDWFLVAIEACSGGTPDLGFFSGVFVFIRIFGVGFMCPSHPRGRGPCLRGWARPLPRGFLVASLMWTPSLPGCFPSKIKFREVSGQLDFVWYSFSVKLKNKEKQKLALGSRLIG